MKRERWGLPPWGWRTPPLGVLLPPIYWRVELIFQVCSFPSTSWSLLPLFHHNESWLRRSPARVVSPPPRRRVGGPGGSSTSAAQLERGYGGLRQAVRVTEHGCATSL